MYMYNKILGREKKQHISRGSTLLNHPNEDVEHFDNITPITLK